MKKLKELEGMTAKQEVIINAIRNDKPMSEYIDLEDGYLEDFRDILDKLDMPTIYATAHIGDHIEEFIISLEGEGKILFRCEEEYPKRHNPQMFTWYINKIKELHKE